MWFCLLTLGVFSSAECPNIWLPRYEFVQEIKEKETIPSETRSVSSIRTQRTIRVYRQPTRQRCIGGT